MKMDLTGQTYNNIYVIEETNPIFDNRNFPIRMWHCRCNICGKEFDVMQQNILNGNTKSCGCSKSKSLEGQRFGHLVAIEPDYSKIDNRNHRIKRWKCKCDCGNYTTVVTTRLLRGITQSCGCVESRGEEQIIKLLSKYECNFKTQHTFNDLVGPNGGLLRFDFAIFDKEDNLKMLIEYQGIQHKLDYENQYGRIQKNITDPLKEKYCEEHNILLYKIWFDENIKESIDKILHDNTVPSSQETV